MLTISAAELQQWIVQLFWPLTRILACIAVAPILSHPSIPKRVKLAIGMVLTVAIVPTIQVPAIEVFSWQGLMSLLAQFLIGISMGFVMRVIFSSIEMAGFMIGMSMGLGFASFYDPNSRGQSMAISQFLVMICMMVFLTMDGHLMMIASLAQSFTLIPIASGHWQLNSQAIALLGATIFEQGLLLSLPVVASLLMTNMALGILTKAAPQLNIFGIGFPITIGVGLIMTLLSLPTFVNPMTHWMVDGQQWMLQVVK